MVVDSTPEKQCVRLFGGGNRGKLRASFRFCPINPPYHLSSSIATSVL
jgi:hypothetical protein